MAAKRTKKKDAPQGGVTGDGFIADVFISYSSRDNEWVRGELLERIERAGLKAFIDFRDFTRGAPSIKECERGAEKCRKILLILTPDYVESEWCEFEVIMSQTLSPANRDLRLIPLLKEPCEKPLHVGALTHIDFTDGADIDLAWKQLLTALGAPPEPEQPVTPERENWYLAHPYPMPPNFTGRVAEREMLTKWLKADAEYSLLSIRALGGFGKSALAWHWLTHDVDPAAWPRVVWWSFYEGDASFDHFLTEALKYLGGGTIPVDRLSGKNAVFLLLEMLHAPGTLLILDGFERALRAFGGLNAAYQGDDAESEVRGAQADGSDRDCVSPLAEFFLYNVALHPNLRSKVLLTTRLCPRILEARGGGFLIGCREEELTQMQPADAVDFFRAKGIRGTHTEIEQACEAYGYHPLSLCLLAGLIVGDFEQPGDVEAARRLDVSGDLIQRQNHVLKVAYESLTPERGKLLSQIACYRFSVRYDALKALAEANATTETQSHKEKETEKKSSPPCLRASVVDLDADLRDLVARGLLHHDTKEGRFDLHPIVRRYAYDRLAARDRAAAHIGLRDYFAAAPKPEKVTCVDDLAPVIELYHHTVRAGQFDEACTLYRDRLTDALYYQLGAYQLCIELLRTLFIDGEDGPPRLKDEGDQGWTLNELANSYSLSGQPRSAVPLFEQYNKISEKLGDRRNLAIGLGNLAHLQTPIGALWAAETNLRRSVEICLSIKKEFDQAIGHKEMGLLLAYRGVYAESETELTNAVRLFENQDEVEWQGLIWACRAQRGLLLLRSVDKPAKHDPQDAIDAARRALELADETARKLFPHERDYVQAHWLLGAAYRVAAQYDVAERHLHEAIERCRRINLVEMEAAILIDLARLRAAIGETGDARRLAAEALGITERCGYVLQGADARLELAKLARDGGDRGAALEHAREALRLATCDGPPDYTYKAAYDEAAGLIGELET